MKHQKQYRNKHGKFASKRCLKFWLIVILLSGAGAWVKLSQFHDETLTMEVNADELRGQLTDNIYTYDNLDSQTIWSMNNIKSPGKYLPKLTARLTAYSCQGITTEAERMMNCPSSFKHPQGRTANGSTPEVGKTVACPKSMLGKKIYIKQYDKTFECSDTGSKITEGRLDLYVGSIAEAYKHGVKTVDYSILWNTKQPQNCLMNL